MWRKLFLEHPEAVGESYGEHLRMAASFGVPMILGGLACLAHGLVPALFRSTGSATVRRLHARLSACPHRGAAYAGSARPDPASLPAE